ncbi:MAG: hypothetical protein V1728_04255 [Candidatus Micrarchaeota archaeon]
MDTSKNKEPSGMKWPLILAIVVVAVGLVLAVLLVVVLALGYGINVQKGAQAPASASCASGVSDGPNGICCAYVCNATCANGYKPGTCRCECTGATNGNGNKTGAAPANNSNATVVKNLDSVFGEPSGNITMPSLPD